MPTDGTRWRAPATWRSLLYDLDADPHELTNLVGSPGHAAVRAELRQRLLERIAAAGEEVAEIVPHEDAGLATAASSREPWR